jgi:hypothetical protein
LQLLRGAGAEGEAGVLVTVAADCLKLLDLLGFGDELEDRVEA